MMKDFSEEIKLPSGSKLVLSSSPHVSCHGSVRQVMGTVLCALLPAVLAGIWFFGASAFKVIVLTTVFCVAAEALWCKLAGKPVWSTVGDGSAAVTGVILALNLPPAVPFYVPLIGSLLAIWLGKQVFGGLGHNPFNPAVVARVGLLIALPAAMTCWTPARGMDSGIPAAQEIFGTTGLEQLQKGNLEGLTCATPLSIVSTTPKKLDKSEAARNNFRAVDNPECRRLFFWGHKGGCIGETCAAALLLGFLVLLIFRLIDWRVPVCFAGSVALFTGIIHFFFPGVTPSPLFHLLTGGLLIGAVFMATDMVTTPVTGLGAVIFGCGCGIITSVIRIWGNYPEGVSFSILFMNALVPLIDRWCARRPFGYVPHKEEMR